MQSRYNQIYIRDGGGGERERGCGVGGGGKGRDGNGGRWRERRGWERCGGGEVGTLLASKLAPLRVQYIQLYVHMHITGEVLKAITNREDNIVAKSKKNPDFREN